MKCLPSGEFSIVGFLVWKVFFAIEMIETILWSSTMVVISFFTFVSQLSFSGFVYFDSCFQHVVGS